MKSTRVKWIEDDRKFAKYVWRLVFSHSLANMMWRRRWQWGESALRYRGNKVMKLLLVNNCCSQVSSVQQVQNTGILQIFRVVCKGYLLNKYQVVFIYI